MPVVLTVGEGEGDDHHVSWCKHKAQHHKNPALAAQCWKEVLIDDTEMRVFVIKITKLIQLLGKFICTNG